MSYLVMARRWRPQQFHEVIGQQHVTRTLQQAIARGRVAHAYIFTGPRGVGKTTVARLLAKTVNCRNLQTDEYGLPEPCNECDACKDISGGNALDVIEIDGASNNKVDDIRTLRENIKFSPSSLEKKVYIIDEVHMLSQAAFNAMLKTLEEPPEHAMFIFATTEIHKVPATVLSRCQRFDFKRIPTKGIREQIERIVQGDSLAIDDEAQVSIAVKAEGALRDALSILDQLVAYQGDDPITGEVVRQALGLIDTDLFFRTTDMAATGQVAVALELADLISGGGHDPREFLHGFQRHVMNLLYLHSGGQANELDVSEPHRNQYTEAYTQHSVEDLLRMAEWAAETEDILREALDPQLRLELFLVRLARMDRAIELGALLQKMGVAPESFKHPVQREPVPARPKVAAPPPPPPPKPAQPKAAAPPPPPPPPPQVKEEPEKKAEEVQEKPAVKADEVAEKVQTPVEPSEPKEAKTEEIKPTVEEPVDEDVLDDEEDVEIDSDAGAVTDSLTLDTVRKQWLEFADAVYDEQHTLGPQVEEGAPTDLTDSALTITFAPKDKFAYEQVNQSRETLNKAFRKQFGVLRQIQVNRGDIPDNMRPPRRLSSRELKQEEFKLELEEHPVWKQMVERLDLRFDE